MQNDRVLISGGTGFLGQYLVRDFLDAGYGVTVLCRGSSNRSVLAGLPVEFVEANIEDRDATMTALKEACERWGPHAMVHNAALISYRTRDRKALQDANVQGVGNVLHACKQAGMQRLLHVSSVVTIGVSKDAQAIDEDAPFNAQDLNVDYVRTKRAGECLALEPHPDLSVTVVNPGAIFGPVNLDSNSGRFLLGMAQGKIGKLAPPGGMAAVGVWDCARGTRLALEEGAPGERYILSESYLSSRELFALVGQTLHGRDPVWAGIPRPLWALLRGAVGALSLLREPLMTTPQALRMLAESFHTSGDKARRELGWQPEPMTAVLQRTVTSMRASGDLPG